MEPELSVKPAGGVAPFSGGVLACVTSGGVDERAAAPLLSVVITEPPRDPRDLTSALPRGVSGDVFSFDVNSSSGTAALAPATLSALPILPRMTGRPS